MAALVTIGVIEEVLLWGERSDWPATRAHRNTVCLPVAVLAVCLKLCNESESLSVAIQPVCLKLCNDSESLSVASLAVCNYKFINF